MSKLSDYFDALDKAKPQGYVEFRIKLSTLHALLKPNPDQAVADMLTRFKIGSGYNEFWDELKKRNWRILYLQLRTGTTEGFVQIAPNLPNPDRWLKLKLDKAIVAMRREIRQWEIEDEWSKPQRFLIQGVKEI